MRIDKAISDWHDWYKASHSVFSVKTLHIKLKVWSRGRKSKSVSKVSWQDLHEYVNVTLLRKGITLGTMKQHLSALNSLFTYLNNEAVVSKNPAALIRIDARALSFAQLEPKEKVPITKQEYVTIMAHLQVSGGASQEFWLTAIPLAYYCGLRISDCLTLEYDNFAQQGLVVHTKKRLKRVVLPWDDPNIDHPDLRKVRKRVGIKQMRSGAWLKSPKLNGLHGKRAHVFPWQASSYAKGTTNKWSTAFERMTSDLNILNPHTGNGKTFHMLRHSFVTRLANNGVSIDDIAKKLGHSSTKTTNQYNHGQSKTS